MKSAILVILFLIILVTLINLLGSDSSENKILLGGLAYEEVR